MNIKDIFKSQESDRNTNNSDKTNLLNKIMPCDFTYDSKTQEIKINSPSSGVILDRYYVKDTGNLVLVFSIESNEKSKIYKTMTSPYRDGVSPNAKIAVSLRLKEIVEAVSGTTLDVYSLDFPINTFEEMVEGFLAQLSYPTKPFFANLEFEKEPSKYINFRVSDSVPCVSSDISKLKLDEYKQNLVTTILVDEEIIEEEEEQVEDTDLLSLLNS